MLCRTRTKSSLRRQGFGLIEVIAATALAALLMVAVLLVMTSSARGRQALEAAEARRPVPSCVVQLIQEDIINSQRIHTDENRITLDGHASLQWDGPARQHMPVTIIYSLATYDERSWLVRTQVDHSASTNRMVARRPKRTTSTGNGCEPSVSDTLPASAITTIRSDAVATIFSRRSAPPPPLIKRS